MRAYPSGAVLLVAAAALGACGPGVPATTTATDTGSTNSTDAPAGTGEGSSGAPTTGDPGSTGGTDSTGSTGGVPADCLKPIPAPTSCDPVADACGNATPIAGGGDVFLRGTALTAGDVWFIASRYPSPSCPEALYRVSKQGGGAEWVRLVPDLVAFEADDDAVYLVERTDEMYTMRVSALVDGAETVIGETHGMPRENTYWTTSLTRTRSGVVTYDSLGPIHPSFALVKPTGLTVLASAVEGASLGSAPAHDGERLFFSWSDSIFISMDDGALDRKLVSVAGDTTTLIADNAEARILPTVAVDDANVYFATGDPSLSLMGIARIAKSGGPAAPLFPPADIYIDQVLVDETEVYYHQSPDEVFAVPREGGAPRHVWHGNGSERFHMDAHDLYFVVHRSSGDIPVPGRDFVVRVAKDTVLP